MQSAAIREDAATVIGESFGSGPKIVYLVDSGSIRIKNADGSRTFHRSDLQGPDISGAADFKQTDASGDSYEIDLNRPSVSGVPLTYTRTGFYTHLDAGGSIDNTESFVFGVPTEDADMPKTGSASYATFYSVGIIDKHATVVPAIFGADDFTGSASFTADFLNGSVSTTIDMNNAQHFLDPATVKDFGVLHGTGAIASTGPAFDGAFTDPGVSGEFHGSFFGPHAVEMGMEFHASSSDFDATGTLVGRQK